LLLLPGEHHHFLAWCAGQAKRDARNSAFALSGQVIFTNPSEYFPNDPRRDKFCTQTGQNFPPTNQNSQNAIRFRAECNPFLIRADAPREKNQSAARTSAA
jgi:hypothetical protein